MKFYQGAAIDIDKFLMEVSAMLLQFHDAVYR